MPKYAIIDTETSGLFDFSKPADAPGQPRLASFAAILTDETFKPLEEFASLVKPDGWEITPEITAINGLTTETCARDGVVVRELLDRYSKIILAPHVVVAFNAQYDTKVMRGELRRAGMSDLFEVTPNICTMRACKPFKIEKAGPKKGGFPKLADAYRHFCGEEPKEPHRALPDARTCLAISRKLFEIGALPAPEVHYAKTAPNGKNTDPSTILGVG